ncbi:hydrolase [Paraliobacillus quinghaiensis]|uniref:Hydrolase n=1 Tax=Paraliobacillus quinghaiensis TaxID=470815 RepID=A0A917WVX3_9BACI|nr:carbon-nitrogen family hydrolase [Paraliobacillus quinghaiensis]GGM33875.1 hydrolase [Paraliobacillus quinghaiensis]
MTLSIALFQMDIAFGKPDANKQKIHDSFIEIAEKNIDIVVLPELWTTGYDLTRLDEIADRNAKDSIAFLSSLAKQYNVNIVGGSIAKLTEQGNTNDMLVINRDGELVKEYEKAHLFRLMDEEKHLIEGKTDGLFELEGEPSAGVICYDIRFPEWIRTHMLDGAKMLFVVAEWPLARIDHWKALLLSRAIENQCFVIACNRVGSDPNNEFGGHSMIIGPWGEIILDTDTTEGIFLGEIDLNEVDKVRNTIPIFSDRRPDMYRS